MAGAGLARDGALELEVADAREEAPLVRSIVLRRPDGAPLPGFAPGAHVPVWIEGVAGHRFYSLVNLDPAAAFAPELGAYHIAVRRDEGGAGGSRAAHALRAGDRVRVGPPRDEFPLPGAPAPVLLVAGGIGVTPLLSMAAALRAAGRPFRAAYAARSRAHHAFAPVLRALAGEGRLLLHADDEAGRPLDLAALLAGTEPGAVACVCGPAPMIAAVRGEAARRGWAPERVRSESFAAHAPAATDGFEDAGGDRAFEVELRRSGRVLAVPPGRTILDVLLDAGEDPLHDCRRGDCGVCQCAVLEGEPDHRDLVLSEAERAGGQVIQICVSRARSPRLVLDL